MGKELDDITKLLKRNADGMKVPATKWVEVKSVDWDAKTMTATDTSDGLDYFDILLGIGSIYIKPEAGSRCLIGTIGKNAVANFLIWAESIQEYTIVNNSNISFALINESLELNGSNFGALVKIEGLVSKLNAIEDAFNGHITEYNSHGHGGNGAAPPPPSSKNLTSTTVEELANDKVKHGG